MASVGMITVYMKGGTGILEIESIKLIDGGK